jgi:integrase
MPRPRGDGTPARAARRRKLTERFVRTVRSEAAAFAVWDTYQRGLAVRVQPSGQKSYKVVYSYRGKARWCHLKDATAIGLVVARQLAAEIMAKVAAGKDPLAERQAEHAGDTFGELVERYAAHTKKKNKAWRQGDSLLRRLLLPRWGSLKVSSIARRDVRAAAADIAAPVVANQTLKALSALFNWAIKEEIVAVNPCKGVDQNKVASRERVLSDAEVALFWKAFDDAGLMRSSALKVLLLTGQRPGEVACMRKEHVADGWWTLPGEPVTALGWPGTKNGKSHRVWLPAAARAIIDDLTDGDAAPGFVFANQRGTPFTDLDTSMRNICKSLGVTNKVTPHDLRRTHGTTVTALGFGRDAMNRVQNHREGGIASVYDRHGYATENQRVMEAVARHILGLGEGRHAAKVIRGRF